MVFFPPCPRITACSSFELLQIFPIIGLLELFHQQLHLQNGTSSSFPFSHSPLNPAQNIVERVSQSAYGGEEFSTATMNWVLQSELLVLSPTCVRSQWTIFYDLHVILH